MEVRAEIETNRIVQEEKNEEDQEYVTNLVRKLQKRIEHDPHNFDYHMYMIKIHWI